MKKSSFIAIASALAVIGCTHTGNIVRLEQRSAAGITSVAIMDYTIPVVSITSGPSLYIWQTRESAASVAIEGICSTTNDTSALGIYQSAESKRMEFNASVSASTNSVSAKNP